jgi:tRNA pseudouridine55 synthase
MDGLLVIDKPSGPTSHDVVARLRRLLRERRVGHTGTLDPAATGLLLLVVGRATRLARFISALDKSYEAVIRLGMRTDTGDAQGREVPPSYSGPFPSRDEIDVALDAFRGTFLQQPPAFSAKKIGGKRSHRLARSKHLPPPVNSVRALPSPAAVTAYRIEIADVVADRIALTLECSSGFYVRALAHDLGERLGTGAHLAALRRTRVGDTTLADAISLEDAEGDPAGAAKRIVGLRGLLTRFTSVVLTPEGVRYAMNGRELGPSAWDSLRPDETPGPGYVRLLDRSGDLIGIAESSSAGLLHPSVVLM